jgi:hypothetical protein
LSDGILKEVVVTFLLGGAMIWGVGDMFHGARFISHNLLLGGASAVVLAPLCLGLKAARDRFKYEDSARLVISGLAGAGSLAALGGPLACVPRPWQPSKDKGSTV